eukprot:8591376-Pyramimonas_sp.AAC.1
METRVSVHRVTHLGHVPHAREVGCIVSPRTMYFGESAKMHTRSAKVRQAKPSSSTVVRSSLSSAHLPSG